MMSEEVKMAKMPRCDLCMDGTLAAFDGKTKMGPWAYMCEEHWKELGIGQLGTGYGQRLVLDNG